MNLGNYIWFRNALGLLFLVLGLSACATRPVNSKIDGPVAYDATFRRLHEAMPGSKTIAILAFSGGGTRAASFSYGVLETLRDTQIQDESGHSSRLLDHVDVISGVSGGSFTALAYRLYGDALFENYEHDFLKRNVQGDLIGEAFNPVNWGDLLSDGWGRSEMAANFYDKILFKGATFGDLAKTPGPAVVVSATDLETGTRILFTEGEFNMLCSDLAGFRVARAAAASSAVPIVLSPLTINNYSGSCHLQNPTWLSDYQGQSALPRAVDKVMARIKQVERLDAKANPYLHLVDGGVSDNLGLRSVLDMLNFLEAMRDTGHKTELDGIENIVVFVVDSQTSPKLNWNKREDSPGFVSQMIQSASVPIDANSSEQISDLKDIEFRWHQAQEIKSTVEFQTFLQAHQDMPAAKLIARTPDVRIYVVTVAFSEVADTEERSYLNNLPTSFVLEPEQVDRLRFSARKIVLNSPEFKKLMNDLNAKIVDGSGRDADPLTFSQ